MVHVLGFAGSLREKSHNRGLLGAAGELLPEGMTLEVFDLAAIPLYNADLEAQGTPGAVHHFQRQIAAADALLIATPEYNYSIPGVLKNALDWASRRISEREPTPLAGKPAAVIGAGGRYGTVRAQMHLRYILLSNDMQVMGKPELMVVRAWEHFDEHGRLANEETRQQLRGVLQALLSWTRKLR